MKRLSRNTAYVDVPIPAGVAIRIDIEQGWGTHTLHIAATEDRMVDAEIAMAKFLDAVVKEMAAK